MISFQNNGLIDLRALVTFGISVKDTDNPIGYFGTGIKYAIAIILRGGGNFAVFVGLDEYVFTISKQIIREKEFGIIKMNDTPLGFTTDVGKNWEPWMAYRELYSNTKDENGEVRIGELTPEQDKTTIHVESSDIEQAYLHHDEYFITQKPDAILTGVEVIKKPSNIIYYKGVRVGKYSDPGVFTYNILHGLDLTEDRTNLYDFQPLGMVTTALSRCNDHSILQRVLTVPESLETALEYSSVGEDFIEVVSGLNFKEIKNQYAIKAYKKATLKEYGPKSVVLNDVEKIQLQKATSFLRKLGFDIDGYPLYITEDLPTNILGRIYESKIYIAKRVFMMGTKMLAGTILEEWLHRDKQLDDESREMQNYLFDLVITLGERINGEPL